MDPKDVVFSEGVPFPNDCAGLLLVLTPLTYVVATFACWLSIEMTKCVHSCKGRESKVVFVFEGTLKIPEYHSENTCRSELLRGNEVAYTGSIFENALPFLFW